MTIDAFAIRRVGTTGHEVPMTHDEEGVRHAIIRPDRMRRPSSRPVGDDVPDPCHAGEASWEVQPVSGKDFPRETPGGGAASAVSGGDAPKRSGF